MMFDFSTLSEAELEQLARFLASNVTGTQITKYFNFAEIDDMTGEGFTKWTRIYNSFVDVVRNGRDDKIVKFIELISNPVNFKCNSAEFNCYKDGINEILLYMGCELNDKGKIEKTKTYETIDEVAERVNKLQAELNRRSIHPKVMM